jgi:hypothetical protein
MRISRFEKTLATLGKERGILAIFIGAIVTLTVAYWQFIYKPPAQDASSAFTYATLVQDANSRVVIRGANVTIYVEHLAPLTEITDNNGYVRFQIPATYSGKPSRLMITIKNYDSYDKAIDLTPDRLPSVITLTPQ